jgi:predicted RNase H-like HicB family nuclease
MATYIAILRKDQHSDYGVSFPDLPGCVTAGKDLEEARKNAAEALTLHLEGMAEEGLPIPEPATLDAVIADRENVDGIPFLVEAPDPEPKAVRVNITLPAPVLEQIDAYVANKGTTRSAFLATAAMERIARREPTSPRDRR